MDLNDLRTYLKTENIPSGYQFQNKIEEEKVSVYIDGNHKKLAVKKYDLAYLNQNAERCYNEIKILRQLDGCQWVIELIDSFITVDDDAYLLLPYYPYGDLFKVMESAKEFYDVQIRYVTNQMLSILTYLRTMKIIHRDIKLENIIAADSSFLFSIKLIDFECATVYDQNCPPTDNVGTVPYKAPEVEKYKSQDYKVDIWSLGVVIYTMKTGNHFNWRVSLKHPIIKNDSNLLKLLKGMLVKQSSKRFSIEQCTNHKWLNIEKLWKNFGKRKYK